MKHSVENRPKLRDDPYLTPKGERFFGHIDATKAKTAELLEKAKKPAVAALGIVAATGALVVAYDGLAPEKPVSRQTITLEGAPPKEGDISILEEVIEQQGYDPNVVRDVVYEGRTMRSEAEKANSDAATVTIFETPLGRQRVDVSFKDESDSQAN